MTEGITEVQARISQLQRMFVTLNPPVRSNGALTVGGTNPGAASAFSVALEEAKAGTGTGGTTATTASTASIATTRGGATDTTAGRAGATGAQVVATAKKYLGIPYVWGGTNPDKGLDCSGLVQRVYADLGIKLPRVSRDQAKVGTPVNSLAEARPGDLVAFRSPVGHIGIYVGDGKMLHAPRTGKDVRIEKITEKIVAIRRILPENPAVTSTGAASSTSAASRSGGGAGSVPYAGLFRTAAAKHGVPATLLAAVAKAESDFRPGLVSHAGARGLMQIMPGTARELGVDPFNPTQAVDGAARLLAKHIRKFGSIPLALAAYNAGPGAVSRYDGIPPYEETRTYVKRVQKYMGEVKV